MKKLHSVSIDSENISIETKYEYANGILQKTITDSSIGSTSSTQFEYNDAGKLIRETKVDNLCVGSTKTETTDIQYEDLIEGCYRQIRTTCVEDGDCQYINTEEKIFETEGGKILEIHSEDNEEYYNLTDIFFVYDNQNRVQDKFYFSRHAEWNDELNKYDTNYYNYRERHSYAILGNKVMDTITANVIELVNEKSNDTVMLRDIVFEDNYFQDVEPTKHYYIEKEEIPPHISRTETETREDRSFIITDFDSNGKVIKRSAFDSDGDIIECDNNGSKAIYTYDEQY